MIWVYVFLRSWFCCFILQVAYSLVSSISISLILLKYCFSYHIVDDWFFPCWFVYSPLNLCLYAWTKFTVSFSIIFNSNLPSFIKVSFFSCSSVPTFALNFPDTITCYLCSLASCISLVINWQIFLFLWQHCNLQKSTSKKFTSKAVPRKQLEKKMEESLRICLFYIYKLL